jgi:hypothetical protein
MVEVGSSGGASVEIGARERINPASLTTISPPPTENGAVVPVEGSAWLSPPVLVKA